MQNVAVVVGIMIAVVATVVWMQVVVERIHLAVVRFRRAGWIGDPGLFSPLLVAIVLVARMQVGQVQVVQKHMME